MVPWQPLVGSPVVPAGHLHLNDPTVFSQKAPGPQDEVFALHSSISKKIKYLSRSIHHFNTFPTIF